MPATMSTVVGVIPHALRNKIGDLYAQVWGTGSQIAHSSKLKYNYFCDKTYYMWKMIKRNPTCIRRASIVLKYRGPLKSPAPSIRLLTQGHYHPLDCPLKKDMNLY